MDFQWWYANYMDRYILQWKICQGRSRVSEFVAYPVCIHVIFFLFLIKHHPVVGVKGIIVVTWSRNPCGGNAAHTDKQLRLTGRQIAAMIRYLGRVNGPQNGLPRQHLPDGWGDEPRRWRNHTLDRIEDYNWRGGSTGEVPMDHPRQWL